MRSHEIGSPIRCPICKKRFSDEEYCKHLVISADDSEIIERCISFADARDIWTELTNASARESLTGPVSFVIDFIEPCVVVARVDSQPWDGGFPGSSGVWFFVWAEDAELLRKQIQDRIQDILTNPVADSSDSSPHTAHFSAEQLAGKIIQITKKFGGATLDGPGNNLAESEDDPKEKAFIKRKASRRARIKRFELHKLATLALGLCGGHRSEWLEALEILKCFCAGDKEYSDLIAARRAFKPTLAGVYIGLNHQIPNASAALACYSACDPDLVSAIERTEYYYSLTVTFAKRQQTRCTHHGLNGGVMKGDYSKTIFQSNKPCSSVPKCFAIVTAHNPHGLTVQEEENHKFDAQLQSILETRRIVHWRVVGAAPDGSHSEAGFGIDTEFEEALNLARAFRQEAIYWVDDDALFLVSADGTKESLGSWRSRQSDSYPQTK